MAWVGKRVTAAAANGSLASFASGTRADATATAHAGRPTGALIHFRHER